MGVIFLNCLSVGVNSKCRKLFNAPYVKIQILSPQIRLLSVIFINMFDISNRRQQPVTSVVWMNNYARMHD